jgi:hypothetical protein
MMRYYVSLFSRGQEAGDKNLCYQAGQHPQIPCPLHTGLGGRTKARCLRAPFPHLWGAFMPQDALREHPGIRDSYRPYFFHPLGGTASQLVILLTTGAVSRYNRTLCFLGDGLFHEIYSTPLYA